MEDLFENVGLSPQWAPVEGKREGEKQRQNWRRREDWNNADHGLSGISVK